MYRATAVNVLSAQSRRLRMASFAQGLRYTNFHSTALCSPTRAAIITGRNHHSVGTGVVGELATGFPGYDTIIPIDKGTIGTILKENGYATSWFGIASARGPELYAKMKAGEYGFAGYAQRVFDALPGWALEVAHPPGRRAPLRPS